MNHRCPICLSSRIHPNGTFYRTSDSKTIQRFRCYDCSKSFSDASFSENYCQNKRRLNSMVAKLLASGISQRRCALVLNTTRKTIHRKLKFLASRARIEHEEFLRNLNPKDYEQLQLDDLITSHHTKLKPISVSVVIEKKRRKFLGLAVSVIPAFGHLAKPSVAKYGKRKNELKKHLDELFSTISPYLSQNGRIESDEHKFYPQIIPKHLPKWEHQTYPSIPAAVVGQGELKKKAQDPLFSVNHTLAMMRANINRLFRRTWNTTKNLESLRDHLWIYVSYHNTVLTK